jgi:hypothetical protein
VSGNVERLLDAWLPPEEAGAPVACLATTFTFDPTFFEEECLARFLGLDSAPATAADQVDAAHYVIERDEALTEAFATVLVDRGQASPSTSYRWDVIATGAPPGGVQHSKLSVLLWERRARMIISSANLTAAGYRENIEVFLAFDWPSERRAARLFRDAAAFLETLLVRHTAGEAGPKSPRGRARRTVRLLRERVPQTAIPPQRRGDSPISLIHSFRSDSLLQQAFTSCWRANAPKEATVISPYFISPGADTKPIGLEAVRLALARRGNVLCEVAATAVMLPGDHLRLEAPEVITESAGRGELVVRIWDRSPAEVDRKLHAKAICFWHDRWSMVVCGSANCTGAGLGLAGSTRNVELSLALGDRPGRALDQWLPRLSPIPDVRLSWESPIAEEEVEGAFADRLPAKFREALYHPVENELSVEIDPDRPPATWAILHGEDTWFTADTSGGASRFSRELKDEAPPLELSVKWEDTEGRDRQSTLVVGVADRDALPPPPELGELELEDIFELLAAGSRLRSVLRRLVDRRLGGKPRPRSGRLDSEIDPHARVDTSVFMLQRMRRAGEALDGLRERLERPVATRDAVQFRLTGGPLSPRALGERINEAVEAGTYSDRERAFLLAELILTLRRVRWCPTSREVTRRWCVSEAEEMIAELGALETTGDSGIDQYLASAVAGR